MLRILYNALRAKVVTTRYPGVPSAPPDRFRGMPLFHPGSRLPPPSVCPVGAIHEAAGGDVRRVSMDLGRCVFCGRCGDDPWTRAVSIGRDFELAQPSRDGLRIEVLAGDPGGQAVPSGDPGPCSGLDADHAPIAAEVRRLFGRSLHLRHLDSGSCNACDWELTALLNPVYDVRRLGIDFVASPRHADGVMVTGPVTRNLETAVRRTLEAIPEPRLVIAVGACAISGGVAGRGYASSGGVDRALPVDVYIPGCPPRPEAILFGILLALGRMEARRL